MKKLIAATAVFFSIFTATKYTAAAAETASEYDLKVEKRVQEILGKNEDYVKLSTIKALTDVQVRRGHQLSKYEKTALAEIESAIKNYESTVRARVQAEEEEAMAQRASDFINERNLVDAFSNFLADKLGNGNRNEGYGKVQEMVSIIKGSPTNPKYSDTQKQLNKTLIEFMQTLPR